MILAAGDVEVTLACLRSLRGAGAPGLGVTLVVNGAADGLAAAARRDHPEVDVVELPANLGGSTGRNVGVATAPRADYLLFLDNDTEVEPGFLAPLLAAADADPGAGALGATIVHHHAPDTVWTAGGRVAADGVSESLYAGRPVAAVPSAPYPVDWIPSCALLVRRKAFDAIGGFDDDLFVYYEDTDWCLRARQAGWGLVHVPGPPVLHRGSRSQGGPGAPSRIYYMTRNGLRVTRRRLGARPAARMLRRELGLARRELREGDRASGRARLRGIAHFLTGRAGRLR